MPNKYLDSVGLAEYTTLIKTALDDKADLASPALTGTPTAPTPTAGDDSTKIATTEFVQDEVANYLPLTGGSVTGNLTVSGTITGNVTGTASGNLPLSGGTMTGVLYFDTGGEARIQNNLSTNDGFVGIYGGGGYTNGAYIILSGKNRSANAGAFSIYANDGVNGTKSLQGKSDGTLIWNGNTIPTRGVNIQTGKTASTSVAANSTESIAITFSPAFSSTPTVFATVQTSYNGFYASVGGISTSGASIKVNNASGTARSVTVGWVAISL